MGRVISPGKDAGGMHAISEDFFPSPLQLSLGGDAHCTKQAGLGRAGSATQPDGPVFFSEDGLVGPV